MLKCILIIDDDGVTKQLYSMILSKMNVAEKIGSFSYGRPKHARNGWI
jgi:hypothetical protein